MPVIYLLIITVAQPTWVPGSNIHGLHVGQCERQERGKGGRSSVAAEVRREGRSWKRWMEKVECLRPSE